MQTVWLDQKVLDVALYFGKLILGLILDVGADVRLEVYVGLKHSGHFFGNVKVGQIDLWVFEVNQGLLLLNAERFAIVDSFGKVLQLYVYCQ